MRGPFDPEPVRLCRLADESQIKEQAARRPATSCPARRRCTDWVLWFSPRRLRACGCPWMTFAQYSWVVKHHKAIVVDRCSHDARCVHRDAPPVLFASLNETGSCPTGPNDRCSRRPMPDCGLRPRLMCQAERGRRYLWSWSTTRGTARRQLRKSLKEATGPAGDEQKSDRRQ
jgi:hypothetical protein